MSKLQHIRFAKELNALFIEDDQSAREATYLLLCDFFNEVIIAEDGFDGLQKFKDYDFDVIITDIIMPNMDGIEMIQKIREIDKDIPIIVQSAYSNTEYLLDTIRLGVDGYILKPINLDQAIMIIEKVSEKVYLKKENERYIAMLEEYKEAAESALSKEIERIANKK
jgi:YesN/AraC family two-component response regulator